MPDILDATGLQTKTYEELVVELQDAMKLIYGNDINLDQNSPDGQLVGIFAKMGVDIRELLTTVYNSFNPDRAVGRVLDERVVINNIERAGGTFTIQPIELTLDRTVSLQGLDGDFNNINGTGYTVQDDAGNQFILVDSATLIAGVHSLNFRAQRIGRVETTVGTINNPVTIVLGVTTVDNPDGALEIGQDEETDAQLRTRRAISPSIKSTGYLNGLLAAILQLTGVTDAKLYENVTDAVDVNGIPAHGIWAIVEGGANSDIAQAIYAKKSYGANMKGAVAVDITTASGGTFTAKFDRPVAADLYIRFDIQPTVAGAVFDQAAIKQSIVDAVDYNIGDAANTATLTAIALAAIVLNGGNGVPVNMEISSNGVTWIDYITTPTLGAQWVVDTTRIAITVL